MAGNRQVPVVPAGPEGHAGVVVANQGTAERMRTEGGQKRAESSLPRSRDYTPAGEGKPAKALTLGFMDGSPALLNQAQQPR